MPEVFPEYLGQENRIVLRAYCTRENLTQKEVAARTGIPQHHISEMETGKRPISKERRAMMNKPLESDWKTFRKRVPEWRERYLAGQNRQIAALLADGEKTPTEQFWQAEKKIKAVARILADCLDGHTRSKMEMYLCLMYRHKMIGADDLEEFSGEIKERILLMVGAISG